MMRNMIRRAIRANGTGDELISPLLCDGEIIATYSQDRVVSGIAPAATHEADQRRQRDGGRRLSQRLIAHSRSV